MFSQVFALIGGVGFPANITGHRSSIGGGGSDPGGSAYRAGLPQGGSASRGFYGQQAGGTHPTGTLSCLTHYHTLMFSYRLQGILNICLHYIHEIILHADKEFIQLYLYFVSDFYFYEHRF